VPELLKPPVSRLRVRASASRRVQGWSCARKAAQRFFLRWAQLDRIADKSGRQPPSDAEIIASLRVIEDVVEAGAGLFFDSLHSVREVQSAANAVHVRGPGANG
jgi:hypothetical protein